MKIIKKRVISGEVERKIVIASLSSPLALRTVADLYSPGVLGSKAAAYAVEAAVRFFQKHGTAPGKHIQDIFELDVDRGVLDEEMQQMVGQLLASCSKQYEQEEGKFNADYYSDLARRYFAGRKIQKLTAEARQLVEADQIEEAQKILQEHREKSDDLTPAVNPFTDAELLSNAFEVSTEPLLRFSGAYGEMVNDLMVREGFVSFMGPEKRGKTWELIEVAVAGLKARCNVAFFSVGDMSDKQLALRMAIRLAGKSNRAKYCREHWEPVQDCVLNQTDECSKSCRTCSVGLGIAQEDLIAGNFDISSGPRGYIPCDRCKNCQPSFWYRRIPERAPLEWREAYKVLNRFYSDWAKGRQFRMACFPNSSMSVSGLDSILERWAGEKNPFVPDLVITDYMDILAPEPAASREFRHQENEKWKAMRRLSQKWHCLSVTATQADAASFSTATLQEENFSEDKRKYGHVTGLLTLNQTPLEKQLGMMRIGTLFAREEEFHRGRTCTQLQNLRRGRPHLCSFEQKI